MCVQIKISLSFMHLRRPGSNNTSRATKTRSAQILAYKYHFPLKITRASLMKLWNTILCWIQEVLKEEELYQKEKRN